MAYILILEDPAQPKFWAYGYPGKWIADKADARQYARRQSANNARLAILRSQVNLQGDLLKILEVPE